MRNYTIIVHSFLMMTSVLASQRFHIDRRQSNVVGPTTPAASAQTTPAQTSPASASQPTTTDTVKATTSSSSSATPSTPTTTTSTAAAPTTTPATPSSTPLTTSAVGSTSSPQSTSLSNIQETTSASTSTDAQGSPVTVLVTNTISATPSLASAAPTGAPQDNSSNSSHSSTIIGLSVAGGVAALAIIAFIVWKLTRKRFSDLDDSDEAIKWPELNHEHTDVGNNALTPQVSNAYSASAPSRNPSTFDQPEHMDPYAVPPLPQFNPSQPYRDDPYASSNPGYYDPYRGPIPQSFNDSSVEGHENIPMSTYPPGSRSKSPGPGMAYDMGGRGSPAPGRASPSLGPGYDTGARGSPGPGRTISPGPAAALGLDRRPAYDVSGPPEMAARNKSPGPNLLG